MKRPMDQTKLLRGEQGVTSIEYALLGALIAMVIIASVAAVGSSVSSLYQMIAAAIP
ncbi:Flp family type IVb pilin [Ralstonia sp. UBA689]|uniref:Flp family type IVb pilin n=1 Tax=Ralstonia sp. UBA689 TaxID=1947373 RepID=UPI0025E279AD|nr:Flp family type IVb pilin [Ralstonia sp. UBA689]